jgi:uncharacterized protein YdhG (YjbR/CyaY superfamily)
MTTPSNAASGRTFVVLSVVSAALVCAALAVWVVFGGNRPSSPPTAPLASTAAPPIVGNQLDFAPFALHAPAVSASWAAEREGSAELDAAATEILGLWRAANFVAAMTSRNLLADEGSAAAETDRVYRDELRRWVSARGPEAYRDLSWPAWEMFAGALDALVAAAAARNTTPLEVLENPVDPVSHEFFEAAGDFTEQALRIGLIDADGRPLVERDVMMLVFRYRWFAAARAAFPIEQLMPGPEYREFLRWRIEDGRGIPLDARLRFIDDYVASFGAFPGYPADFARAVAYFNAGDTARAGALVASAAAIDPSLAHFRNLFDTAGSGQR